MVCSFLDLPPIRTIDLPNMIMKIKKGLSKREPIFRFLPSKSMKRGILALFFSQGILSYYFMSNTLDITMA